MNGSSIAAIIIVISIVSIFKLIRNTQGKPTVDYPYKNCGVLFSPAERSFYGVLEQIVGDGIKVFGKVRVADIIEPRKGLSRGEWQKAFNKVSAKHIDFLLCNSNDLSIICAIELDDASHQSSRRQSRDAFLKSACDAAGVPFVQIPAKSGYVIDTIKQVLEPFLNQNVLLSKDTDPQSTEIIMNDKTCPACFSPMLIRVAKKGVHLGESFWACSNFPVCRHTEVIKKNRLYGVKAYSPESSIKEYL